MATAVVKDKVELGFNAEVRSALAAFKEAKDAIKQAEAKKAEAELVLRNALGTLTEATIGGVSAFKLVNGSNSHADLKTLAEAFPEAFNATVRTTKYNYIKAI